MEIPRNVRDLQNFKPSTEQAKALRRMDLWGAKYLGDVDEAGRPHGEGVLLQRYSGSWEHGARHGHGVGWLLTGVQESYEGEWANDKPHGEGTRSYANGDIFTGSWISGVKDGPGMLRFRNGDTLKGIWKDEETVGSAAMTYSNQDMYEGELRSAGSSGGFVRHGRGAFFNKKARSTYDGEFFNGLTHGHGRLQVPGKFIFEGEFENGIRKKGVTLHADGVCFEGDWKDTEKLKGLWWGPGSDGQGAFFYYGSFLNGLKHGAGCLLDLENETEFRGMFVCDAKAGDGALHCLRTGMIECGPWVAPGTAGLPFYSGQWDAEKVTLHGHGLWTFSPSLWYRGMWNQGTRHGCGVEVCGLQQYVGDFVEDIVHGQGFMTFADGSTYTGQWEGAKRHGHGIFHRADLRAVYQGEWKNDYVHGAGTLFTANGISVNGHFDNGKLHGSADVFLQGGRGAVFRGVWDHGSPLIVLSHALVEEETMSSSPVCAICNNTFSMLRKKKTCAMCFRSVCDAVPTCYTSTRSATCCKTCEESKNNECIHGALFHVDKASVYCGNFRSQKFHGPGIMLYGSSSWYDGEWVMGLPHGRGRMVSSSSREWYEGSWSGGFPEGEGRYYLSQGRVAVEGVWSRGVLTALHYYGEWCHLTMTRHGLGVGWEEGKASSSYNGTWVHGVKEGWGVATSPQWSYRGTWMEHRPHGLGIYHTENYVHTGLFAEGIPHGAGSRSFLDTAMTRSGTWNRGLLTGTVFTRSAAGTVIGVWGEKGGERNDAFVPQSPTHLSPGVARPEIPSTCPGCALPYSGTIWKRTKVSCGLCATVFCDECAPVREDTEDKRRLCLLCHRKALDGLSILVVENRYYGTASKGKKHGKAIVKTPEGDIFAVEYIHGKEVSRTSDETAVEEAHEHFDDLREFLGLSRHPKDVVIPELPTSFPLFYGVDHTNLSTLSSNSFFHERPNVPPAPERVPPCPKQLAAPVPAKTPLLREGSSLAFDSSTKLVARRFTHDPPLKPTDLQPTHWSQWPDEASASSGWPAYKGIPWQPLDPKPFTAEQGISFPVLDSAGVWTPYALQRPCNVTVRGLQDPESDVSFLGRDSIGFIPAPPPHTTMDRESEAEPNSPEPPPPPPVSETARRNYL